MWHVETDYFALAIFLIMLVKKRPSYRLQQDVQGKAFFIVLIVSIVNVIVDICASLAQNSATQWWPYEVLMTTYAATMPLLAAAWVGYVYVSAHKDMPQRQLMRRIALLLIPYLIYLSLAFSNPATELFFHLSASTQYSRGVLFMPVGVGMIMFYSLLGFILVLANHKRITPRANVYLLAAFFRGNRLLHLGAAFQSRLAYHQRQLRHRVRAVRLHGGRAAPRHAFGGNQP